MSTKNKQVSGNRCGHDPKEFKHCNNVKRSGNKKTPPAIAWTVALLATSMFDSTQLRTWHRMNKTRRRSERREAAQAITQFLFLHWYRLESQTCGDLRGDTLVVPDARQIARQISKSPEWKGKPKLNVGRVRAVLKEFEACGYIKRNNQRKLQRENGRWESGPQAISFTKKFFKELHYGTSKLWDLIYKERKIRLKPIIKAMGQVIDLPVAIAKHFRPAFIRTQGQIDYWPNPTASPPNIIA